MAAPTYDAVSSGGATATSVTVAHTCGGSNRVLYVATLNRNAGAGTVTGVTYNSVAMTRIQTTVTLGSSDFQVWRLVAPASGTNNIVASLSGSRQTIVVGVSYSDADQSTPEGTSALNAGLLTVNVTGTADTNILSFPFVENSSAPSPPQFAATGTAQTERADAAQAAEFLGASTQTGSGTVTASWTYAGSTTGGEERNVYAVPVNGITAPAGPTIDTQPTAQTCTINNSSDTTATFTVAATTSGGALSYQWQLEDSVGGGTYSNISNGGIYSGATSTSLVVTPTTKTGLTGKRVRCNVTDSNGTTATNAVVLTVYSGFQFTSSTTASTNGSGVATVTWTDDRAGSVLGNGGFVKGIATTSSSTSRTSQRPT